MKRDTGSFIDREPSWEDEQEQKRNDEIISDLRACLTCLEKHTVNILNEKIDDVVADINNLKETLGEWL